MTMTYNITIKTAEAGTALAEGGSSSVGHTWFVLSDGNSSQSYGFAPAVHGQPFGPGTVYTTDDTN